MELDQNRFCCSICLDLVKDPVTIPCGHNYCMNCIKTHWDGEHVKMINSCPQCTQTFRPRPVLVKNTMSADLVDELKKTGPQTTTTDGDGDDDDDDDDDDHFYAGPGDVACDFCTDIKMKAVKSRVQCVVSYCHKHLQPHFTSPAFNKHKLMEPSEKLQENVCCRYKEVMKMFCRTDQHCICYLCSVDEHEGHETVTCAAGRTEKQTELEVSRQKIKQRVKDKREDMEVLRQEAETISRRADEAEQRNDEILTEMIRLLEDRRREVKQLIRSEQEIKVSQIKELESKLEQEVTELRRKDSEMDKLSHTEDHIHFLLQFPSVSKVGDNSGSTSLYFGPLNYFEEVTTAVSELRDKLLDNLREGWTNTEPKVLLLSRTRPEPQTRAQFLQYSCPITLDPNTAGPHLSLSEGNRRVTVMINKVKHPFHPDRFTALSQVLSKESLTGRCYWEVESKPVMEGLGIMFIAVTYKNIKRKGDHVQSIFGHNDRSWSLCSTNQYCGFRHNKVNTRVPHPRSPTIGVYLDHPAGLLSFYNVSETMTLLHRVQTTFTKPLYAGISLSSVGDVAEMIQLKSTLMPHSH